MDKTLNPIYPSWTGDDDPNVRFLEEHILRTSIPSGCNVQNTTDTHAPTPPPPQPRYCPYSRNRQQENSSSSSVLTSASAITQEPCTTSPMNEVKKSIDTRTSRIQLSCKKNSQDLQIEFFKGGEEICQISIPRTLNLNNTKQKSYVTFGGEKKLLRYEDLLDFGTTGNPEVQNIFWPLLRVSVDPDQKQKGRIYVHEDNKGISWSIEELYSVDMLCRQFLMPGELVVIFPAKGCQAKNPDENLDLNNIRFWSKDCRLIGIYKNSDLTKSVYEVTAPSNWRHQFFVCRRNSSSKCFIYVKDILLQNVFYKISSCGLTLQENLEYLVKKPRHDQQPFCRPWLTMPPAGS
eukprot:GHVP01011383.1.p1 GENE.GHVP01011383.1~~GHVP01011383.1.p1  ORF type:complete len:348 (+),score=46.38 GHVP01011383.1:27-1070(+)